MAKELEVKIDGQHVKLFNLSNGSLMQSILCPGVKCAEINGLWMVVTCDEERVRIFSLKKHLSTI